MILDLELFNNLVFWAFLWKLNVLNVSLNEHWMYVRNILNSNNQFTINFPYLTFPTSKYDIESEEATYKNMKNM